MHQHDLFQLQSADGDLTKKKFYEISEKSLKFEGRDTQRERFQIEEGKALDWSGSVRREMIERERECVC